ncbi:MAG: hypothetical protein WCV00_04740 [Verrucomicrobiia bacterium]
MTYDDEMTVNVEIVKTLFVRTEEDQMKNRKRKRKIANSLLGRRYTPSRSEEPEAPAVPPNKIAPKPKKTTQAHQVVTNVNSEMPTRIVDLKKRTSFSEIPRQAFRNKLQPTMAEACGMPDPANYPPPGRPTLRIATEVHSALWELLRRIDEQRLTLEDNVQQRLEQNTELDPAFKNALPTMQSEAAKRDQEAVEALAMLAYEAVALVEQLPIARLRPIAQQLEEWPVLTCRHPVAKKDIETILSELEVGKTSLLQTMSPKSRWSWHKEGVKCAVFLISQMRHARFLRSFEFTRNEFSGRFTIRRLLDAITADGVFPPSAGVPNFLMNEFFKPFSMRGLLEIIRADGIQVPKATTEIESLNKLLNSNVLYRRFKKTPPSRVVKCLLEKVVKRSGVERLKLNRLILQRVYPEECPKYPPAQSELESLNWMLRGTGLHRQFKHCVLCEEAKHLMQRISELNDNECTRLNRFILEAAYPQECPKNRFLALGEFKNVERTFGQICKRNAPKWRLYYRQLFDEYFPDATTEPKLRRLIVRDERAEHVAFSKGEWQAKIFDTVWRCLAKTLR